MGFHNFKVECPKVSQGQDPSQRSIGGSILYFAVYQHMLGFLYVDDPLSNPFDTLNRKRQGYATT